MTIAIEDMPVTAQLDREALTATRGGVNYLPTPSPWDAYMPELPSFPSGFPFNGSPPSPFEPVFQVIDPKNPTAQ